MEVQESNKFFVMKLVIPMAGRGTRLRPHTLTVPKPLVPIAGKPIVHRLVEDLAKVCKTPFDEIAFVIGDFGKEVEKQLIGIAESLGAKASIYYQDEALGTAHAIWVAKESLKGNVVIAFADLLFKADFDLDTNQDGIIWVKKVDNPSAFGVVKTDDDDYITDFIEKPQEFVSDNAIIGIYYFKDGENFFNELDYLIQNDVRVGKEYQLTTALENMKNKGLKFTCGEVADWLDCGNKKAAVDANKQYLTYLTDTKTISDSVKLENSVIIEPVFIGENVHLKNTVIGPHVSIGDNTTVEKSVIENTIIQANTNIKNVNFKNSMIGNLVTFEGSPQNISIGDYNSINLKG